MVIWPRDNGYFAMLMISFVLMINLTELLVQQLCRLDPMNGLNDNDH